MEPGTPDSKRGELSTAKGREFAMDRTGKLRMDLVDVYGDRLKQRVDIRLRHQILSDRRVVSGASASKRIQIIDLHGSPQGLYRVEVDPPAYLPVSQFVNLKASGITDRAICFPIDPAKVKEVRFPGFDELAQEVRKLLIDSRQVLGFETIRGKELYDGMDDIRRAGFLNITTKSGRTPLANGKTVLPYIEELTELRGDRFFARVPKQLREEIKNSIAEGTFRQVSGSLHHPPEGFSAAGSFKTDDSYGNLQLTFFMNAEQCVADFDIDDAAGLGHVFQVLRNHLTGRPTHPFDIHEILVFHQQLDPGYRFVV